MTTRKSSESQSPLIHYIEQFMSLRNATSIQYWNETTRFQAPQKPILLLACIDLIGKGDFQTGFIEPSPILIKLYKSYWSALFPDTKVGGIYAPFFHMRTSPFWILVAKPGKEEILQVIKDMNSLSQLKELIIGAQLDPELVELLRSEKERDILRAVIASTFFNKDLQSKVFRQ